MEPEETLAPFVILENEHMLKADTTFREVPAPINRYCASGHSAPQFFKETKENGAPKEVKFYSVVGGDIDNVYCELCLIISRHIATQRKNGELI